MKDLQHVVPLIEDNWRGAEVLVVGDVMLDKYIWGDVERISPEAPVPVVRAVRQTEQPGGAANVAMNIAGLGGRVVLIGLGGGDPDQARLEEVLCQSGVVSLLVSTPGWPTTSKLRILGGTQQIVRLDSESTKPRPTEAYAALMECVAVRLPKARAVVLSDYAKGTLTGTVCQSIISQAKQAGIPVLVDPKSRDFERYAGATTICPNLAELSLAVGESADDLNRLLQAGQSLVGRLKLEYLTVTLSEKGIAVLWAESRMLAPAVAQQVFDVSGAGDTVMATLALSLACGMAIETAVYLANAAAGIVVGKIGTAPVKKDELIGVLSEARGLKAKEKVLDWEALVARVAFWRISGKRVVFTNGCFDLLHVGHITLLERSREEGDRLIVAVNSDRSVRKLKGESRPLVGERERARILAALSAVDAVVIFDEDTPLRLIEALRPDVLVKGGDYVEATVVGAAEVKTWGGRVCLVPTVEGFSTSGLIAKAVNE